MTIRRKWVAIQHVPYEGPGLIAEVASRRSASSPDAWSELWPVGALDEPSVTEIERAGRTVLDAFFDLACR